MNDDFTERVRRAIREAESSGLAPGAEAVVNALRTLSDSLDAIERRLAIQQSLLDDRLLRVETNRLFTLWNRIVRLGGAALRPLASRYGDAERTADRDYTVWVAHEQSAFSSSASAGKNRSGTGPTISVVVAPTDPALLRATVDSLCAQVHGNWELCIALPENQGWAADLGHLGNRLRYCTVRGFTHDAALNAAADLATGEFLCFPVEGDSLSRFGLSSVAAALEQRDYDVVYTDEDRLDASGRRTGPLFKPDWSPDLLASSMYMGQLFVIRRGAFSGVKGFRPGAAHLHALALRLAAGGARIYHVRKVLYHARAGAPRLPLAAQTGGPAPAVVPLTAIICSRSPRLLRTCLEALRRTASDVIRSIVVVMHEERGPDEVLRQVVQEAGVEAVSFTGVFNFSEMNNAAARLVHTPGILFLNDDVVASAPGWAEMLARQIAVARIGVAGSLLRYPSGDLQHAGIVTGIGDGVGHIGRYARSSNLWPWLEKTRNVSAVTGACLAIRTELFETLGGFDADFPNNFNDVDLCLRAGQHGFDIVCVPAPGLIHSECQTRRGIVHFKERYRFYTKWGHVLERPDPYYSESLAPSEKISLNLAHEWIFEP